MIIPNFTIKQDNKHIYLDINAFNSKLERTEFDLTSDTILFTSPPYHLRIHLPSLIIINGNEKCDYDFHKNIYKLKLVKLNENENFEGLDMISKLLIGNREEDLKKKNLIEVVDINFNEENNEDINFDDEIFNIEIFNKIDSILNAKYSYGFLNQYNNIIEKYQDEIWKLTDLKNPGEINVELRRKKRLEKEQQDFNEEYYLTNTFDNLDEINKLIKIDSSWLNYKKTDNPYTQDEFFRLKNLPKKEFKLNKSEKICLLYGLVDILFAYCYDKRVNFGEISTESAWNICKLSSTLSWFDCFWCFEDVLIACYRRSLCYPLYRNFNLSKIVFNDVIKLLNNDKSYLIKVFLSIQKLLNEYGEFKYLLNDLYINNYLIYIQYLENQYLIKLVNLLKSKIKLISKNKIDLDIPLLEKCAKLTISENIIHNKFINMKLN